MKVTVDNGSFLGPLDGIEPLTKSTGYRINVVKAPEASEAGRVLVI